MPSKTVTWKKGNEVQTSFFGTDERAPRLEVDINFGHIMSEGGKEMYKKCDARAKLLFC